MQILARNELFSLLPELPAPSSLPQLHSRICLGRTPSWTGNSAWNFGQERILPKISSSRGVPFPPLGLFLLACDTRCDLLPETEVSREIWVTGSAWREPAATPWQLLRGRKRGLDPTRIPRGLRGFPALSRGGTGMCSHLGPAASVSLGPRGSAQPPGWFSHLGLGDLGILPASGSRGSLRIQQTPALPRAWIWLQMLLTSLILRDPFPGSSAGICSWIGPSPCLDVNPRNQSSGNARFN